MRDCVSTSELLAPQLDLSANFNQEMDSLELSRIVFLLSDDNFKSELKIFRRSYQRLKIRLRNTSLTGALKQVKTLIHRLEIGFPIALFEQYRTTKPKPKGLTALANRLSKFIVAIDEILVKATRAQATSQQHFRVGHLIQHYLVVRSSLARLIYCYKALLVYSVDLYTSFHTVKKETTSISFEQAREILLKHDCKPKPELADESLEIVDLETPCKSLGKTQNKRNSNQENPIGELIDRKTLRPVRAIKKRRIS